ncbi:hypothetical protein I7I53_03423 [Histoplasma capsulatum var. duboisii H88]|uniref:Uncharacterized protein n=3 Tax=Ajellomyces capsulatus TaxID=5037 RepID=A0A8A1LNY3_AJEC8|nr:hypothetical protein I7I53_03423 [Histoplasma capsulatum var. duboisii H88]
MGNNPPSSPPHQQSQRGLRNEEQMPPPSSTSATSEPAPPKPSIASRIQHSASGLLQNTFSGSPSRSLADDISSTLTAGLGLSSKGSSPSSNAHALLHAGASASENTLHSHGLSLGQPSSRASGAQRFPSESLRSAPLPATMSLIDEDDQRAWERFQDPTQNNIAGHDNGNDTLFLDPYDATSTKGKGKLRAGEMEDLLDPSASSNPQQNLPNDDFDSAWHNSSPAGNTTRNHSHKPNDPNIGTHHQASYIPHSTDGQDVIALLTSPTFQPATFATPESPQSELLELDPSMLQPPPPSSSASPPSFSTEITKIHPFPPNQLSLIPDINSILSAIQQQSQEPRQHGQGGEWDWTTMPGIAEWLEVDGTYQDTVWGFLKPYVEAAKKEVVERRERGENGAVAGTGEDGPAVKRLRMVLGHLKARL